MQREMSHHLVYYGNKTLHRIASEILHIDQGIIDLIESMFNIMYKERGVGLAAPQIDVPHRLFVIDIESYNGPSLALINPEIVRASDEKVPYEEGCLSVPGISAEIMRPREISVKAINPEGKEISFDADGMLARVIQHELDHLNGKLFIDHLEDYAKKELTPELKRIKKLNKRS